MHHIKMMVLTALAIFALVAFAGASTASATRLCQTNTSPCTSTYPANTAFHTDLLPGTSMVWTTSGSPLGVNTTVTCNASTWGLTSSNTGGGAGVPAAARLTAMSFSGCTSQSPTGCETSWTVGSLAGATGQIDWTSGVNGTLTLALPTLTYSCPWLGAPVSCTFGGSGTIDGTLTGGASPVVDIVNQTVPSTGGFGCSTTAQWNARVAVTRPLSITNN